MRGDETPLRVVLVGFGPVGVRFAEELLPAVDAGRVALTIVGDEPDDPYNRVLLAEYATGHADREGLRIADPRALAGRGVRVLAGRAAARILREAREVELDDGMRVAYDRLVLATGADATVPRLDGLERAADGSLTHGVCALRTMADADRVRDVVASGGRVVVLGAGVLGIELALLLARAGADPQLAHFGPGPMPRSLDRGAASVLVGALERAGVSIVPHTRAEAILTRESADGRAFRALVSSDGRTIEGDLLVLSCGVRPRTALASDAGLRTARGILVDAELRSWSDPNVFAIGDVAHVADPSHHAHDREVPGGPSGLVGPGWRQAERLARAFAGGEPAPLHDEPPGIVSLKADDIDVVAAGTVPGDPFAPVPRGEPAPEIAVWADPRHGTYVSIATTDGVLDGFAAVGMPRAAAELSLLYQRRAELPSDRSLLLRLDAADALVPRPAGRDETVCVCNAVTAGRVEDAVREDGCESVEEIAACTRAGTGCGGCRARIAEMLAEWQGQPA